MEKPSRKTKNIISVIIHILLISFCIFSGYKFYTNAREEAERWRSYTSPLPDDTVRDLCDKFNLPTDDPLCDFNGEVYSGDFFPVIEKTFKPSNSEWLNIDEINSYLGNYLDEECFNMPDNPNINCYYDLRGDRVFTIWAYFDENGNLINLTMPLEQ